MATLYIIATPIGNLEDITLRALSILKKADLILCEDTRVTKKLLNHYNIKNRVQSYHQHSRPEKINYILSLLKQGKNLALTSDSGTPGISDPGNKLIEFLISLPEENFQQGDNSKFPINIVPIPGPNAAITAASISGFPMDRFVFMGFPPHKKGRKKFFQSISDSKYPVIIYESPHRILKTLKELDIIFQTTNSKFQVIACRELTKKFETIYRGEIKDIIKEIKPRGEFVVIVKKQK